MARLTSLSRSVQGRVAIVTGAASGIGRATAHLLADEGVHVAVVDRDADGVARTAAEIVTVHGAAAAMLFALDVTDTAALAAMVEDVVGRFGRLDIVVNNAGVALPSPVGVDAESFTAAWSATLAVNLASYAQLVRLAVPHLMESPSPRIVNIASSESVVATPGLSAYSASKSGVTGLTRGLAVELGRHGIVVNCVCPGPVKTGMTEGIPTEAKEAYARRRVALRRYGEPEEIAHMVLNLCLPASGFVTGATVFVDGGMTVRHT